MRTSLIWRAWQGVPRGVRSAVPTTPGAISGTFGDGPEAQRLHSFQGGACASRPASPDAKEVFGGAILVAFVKKSRWQEDEALPAQRCHFHHARGFHLHCLLP
jgi:hypothetical protein